MNRRIKRRGATAISYGLLVGLISVTALLAVTEMGGNITSLFDTTGTTLQEVVTGPSPTPGPCPSSATPGDTCSDGTIFVGFALAGGPGAGQRLYTMPQDQSTSIQIQDISGDPPSANCNNGSTTCWTGEANSDEMATTPLSDGNKPAIHPAAELCYCLGEGEPGSESGDGVPPECPSSGNGDGAGHDDWYLPALSELDLLYVNLISPDDTDNPVLLQGDKQNSSLNEINGQGGNDGGSRNGPHASGFASAGYWSSSDTNGNFPTMMWFVDLTDGDQNITVGTGSLHLRCMRSDP
ncbi:MAG: hypothetical protein Alpg2KO_17050 [Alphaproteobacteria bacterium]